jgi:hypothetical protein
LEAVKMKYPAYGETWEVMGKGTYKPELFWSAASASLIKFSA